MQIRSRTKDTQILVRMYKANSLIVMVMASLWAWPNNKQQLIRSKGWDLGWIEQREGVRAFWTLINAFKAFM